MGVTGLPALLKEGCSVDVDLEAGDGGVVLADGHWIAHRAVTKPGVAITLMNDCVRKLAFAVAAEVRRFQQRGWIVVLVVDGKVPPAKRATSAGRSARRQAALEEMEQDDLTDAMLAELAKKAVRLTPEIIARMLILVRAATNCEFVVSPYEADGELVVLEKLYLEVHERVHIFCADHDLAVLGAQSLLYEAHLRDGALVGRATVRSMMLEPFHKMFFDWERGEFLRQLHGWSRDSGVSEYVLGERATTRRLLAFALLAGNDYCNLRGIGPVTAKEIALPALTSAERQQQLEDTRVDFSSDESLYELAIGVSERTAGRVDASDACAAMKKAHDMFLHQVVWTPGSGQGHLSGEVTRASLTNSTGVIIADPSVAERIAHGELSPTTGREWEPGLKKDSLIGFQTPSSEGGTGLGQGFGPDLATSNPYTYNEIAASRMPDSSDNFAGWTVVQLSDLLTEIRCTERSGIFGLRRDELVEVAQLCSQVIEESGLAGNRLLFRPPQVLMTREEILKEVLPDLPPPGDHWAKRFEDFCPHAPEIQEAVILAWLCLGQSRKNWDCPPAENGCEQPPAWESPARVLARGMERVMDLGALQGLMATFVGDILYVRHRVHASMNERWYNVYVKIALHHAEAVSDTAPSSRDQQQSAGHTPRRLATVILRALCECRAGRGGKCHHVAMVLQLLRLLGMSERDLEAWDPTTVTGRTCQWLLHHQAGGRGSDENIFWGMTLPEMAQECRQIRDPKGSPIFSEASIQSRGVVPMNRESGFNGYPQGGCWAHKAAHHLAGESISMTQKSNYDKFSLLVKQAGHREEVKRRGVEHATPPEERKVASDVLPPFVRPDASDDLEPQVGWP